ncbi:MAG: DHH family phosphoesterase [Phycisphaerales bacterium]|jgi:phosphoesterase RecJ-like protein|nr:DHH family phosphoesterase [Phycisphaerales bacterium]
MPVNAAETWTTNATLSEIAAWLRAARRVVVLTHLKPDGDAVGSTIAVCRAINKIRPGGAAAWYCGPMPVWFSSLAGDTPAFVLDGSTVPPPGQESEPDAIVILDTGSWSQLEGVTTYLKPRRDRVAVIDHHVQGDADTSGRRYIETSAAAVAEPAAELCRLILGLSSIAELPREVAEPLFVGIATDTGWFKHSNVTPPVLRHAADLLAAGANHSEVYRMIEQQDRPARVRLLARSLSSLELHAENRIAVMSLTRADMADAGGEPGDAGGFADSAQCIGSVRVVAMFTESEVGPNSRPITKLSLRAKNTPDAPDVNKVAKQFGGGGHVRAAGARMNLSLADAKKQVIAALTKAISGSQA